MIEQNVPLSINQAKTHGLAMVSGIVLHDRQDGWVKNEWPNRHLSGSIVEYHQYDTRYGSKHRRDFVPIDNVIGQKEIVADYLTEQARRIAGYTDDTGEHIAGELDELREARIGLLGWLALTPQEKQDIKDYFSRVASVRSRPVNPFNITVGGLAILMKDLKDSKGRDNPGAILARTHPFEHAERARYKQIGKRLTANNARQIRLQYNWLAFENYNIGQAFEALEDIVNRESSAGLDRLKLYAREIRFRVQPFNQFAHATHETNGQIDDISPAEILWKGLDYARHINYLLVPFRQLTTKNKKSSTDKSSRSPEVLARNMQERVDVLDSLRLSGPYGDHLTGRLADLGQRAVDATLAGNAKAAKEAGNKFKWLANYYVLPGDSEKDKATWYRYSLY
jgi:hypothetical protein